ncbi:MAG: DEAD/DEAH box helicase [Candidatus Moranbacteria bacterium]|nr:DEAD/DEAH box helicase [Candidatus Moranbacteria bacterium]
MFEKLAKKALKDEYFLKIFQKAELNNANQFFHNLDSVQELSEKEFVDLMRFADIFSHSKKSEAKNLAYKIICLLMRDKRDDETFKIVAAAVLVKLGNFPALRLLSEQYSFVERLPFEREIEKNIKEEMQKVPHTNKVFTDSQYEIFEALKNNNHFSFSGPTSLGKSFIIESFIHYLASEQGSEENMIVLVPTRALINQVSLKLKNDLKDIKNYRVLTHPIVPELFRKGRDKFIFVFTPERLISFLSDNNNPRIGYLFIDEAQKITSRKDNRSPLYYHAILQAERKSIKLYFSSPNIPNPEIFLQMFEKSTDETITIKDSPVAQNRYFIDLVEGKAVFFSENRKRIEIHTDLNGRDFFSCLNMLGSNEQNIIYCNTIDDTIKYALDYSSAIDAVVNPKINDLIKLIEEYLHREYYLIDCLKKGVAFHFGKLPQRIRVRVEELFREGIITNIFCTSTLLEGVNLPAKNIFILSNAIGLSKFTDIDFWNLAGRAGRLTKELSGNIVCVRAENKKNRWNNPERNLSIVEEQTIKPVKPLVIGGQGNFFKNLENSLKQENFSNENASQKEKDIWNYYANIALIHEIRKDESVLKANFIEKNGNARELLRREKEKNKVPDKILSASSTIKATYQNQIFEKVTREDILPNVVDYEVAKNQLEKIYEYYSWDIEENGGKNPLVNKGSINILKYYAMLMNSWINSDPISKIILTTLKYYQQNGVDIAVGKNKIVFDGGDKRHINFVINKLMGDIENILRFKLEKYFNNYYLILTEKLGEFNAGANWAEFLEYGTTDRKVIELQNIGFSRHFSKYILERHGDCLSFENEILDRIDYSKLERELDKKSDEYQEYKELC